MKCGWSLNVLFWMKIVQTIALLQMFYSLRVYAKTLLNYIFTEQPYQCSTTRPLHRQAAKLLPSIPEPHSKTRSEGQGQERKSSSDTNEGKDKTWKPGQHLHSSSLWHLHEVISFAPKHLWQNILFQITAGCCWEILFAEDLASTSICLWPLPMVGERSERMKHQRKFSSLDRCIFRWAP